MRRRAPGGPRRRRGRRLPGGSEEGATTVAASGKKAKVQICHKGKDKWVPPSAVAGHKRHGDTEGGCAPTCPCYSLETIQSFASGCSGIVNPLCTDGDSYSLFLGCGTPESGSAGYESYVYGSASGGFCQLYVGPTPEDAITGLTSAKYDACVRAIADSGFCP